MLAACDALHTQQLTRAANVHSSVITITTAAAAAAAANGPIVAKPTVKTLDKNLINITDNTSN